MNVFKNASFIGLSAVTALILSGCNNNGTTTSNTSSGLTVTAVDGYVKNATVTDALGQVATYSSSGQYTFSSSPTYPITLTGGQLEDTNETFDINMSVSDGTSTVLSPITTFLGTDTNLLSKFSGLGLGKSTLSEFSIDYVDTNDTDLAKLSQLLYTVLRDSNLTATFKTSVDNNSSLTSINDMFTLASSDINTSSSLSSTEITRTNSFLTQVQDFNGSISNMESSLDYYKGSLVIADTNLTHNGTSYGAVKSPHTGRVWLDRNLGASRVCTSSSDSSCFGDFYQWGRGFDGHQESNSTTTSTQATTIAVGHGNFITGAGSSWLDASVDANGALRSAAWSATDGSSICPSGYRVPTSSELSAETIDLNNTYDVNSTATAFTNFLALPATSYRHPSSGTVASDGAIFMWVSSPRSNNGYSLYVGASSNTITDRQSGFGMPVRCIKAQ